MLTFLDVDFTPMKRSFGLSTSHITGESSRRGRRELRSVDIRLLWPTVSNAADKSTATQTVRSGGFLWLNPTAMSVVNCSRVEVVECSRLKPCWS